MHVCEICGGDSSTHPERCGVESCIWDFHWPPLCCPGCPCGSFEEAHNLPTPFDLANEDEVRVVTFVPAPPEDDDGISW